MTFYGILVTKNSGTNDEKNYFADGEIYDNVNDAIIAVKALSRKEFPNSEYTVEKGDGIIYRKTVEHNGKRRIYEVVKAGNTDIL